MGSDWPDWLRWRPRAALRLSDHWAAGARDAARAILVAGVGEGPWSLLLRRQRLGPLTSREVAVKTCLRTLLQRERLGPLTSREVALKTCLRTLLQRERLGPLTSRQVGRQSGRGRSLVNHEILLVLLPPDEVAASRIPPTTNLSGGGFSHQSGNNLTWIVKPMKRRATCRSLASVVS